MAEKIALFGGSFNPIHNGHLIIARSVAEEVGIDRVIFLPSRDPPHKAGELLCSAGHRAAMVELAIKDEPIFEFSDHDLICDGPSYTVNTVAHFRGLNPQAEELVWIIGGDSLLELHTWYQLPELVDSCRVVTAVRPGFGVGQLSDLRRILETESVDRLVSDIIETPRIDISSTDVRSRIAGGRSIRYLVPESVEGYIRANSLYRA